MAKCALSRPRIRCLGGDAEHAFGASEWEAWHIARDGRETIQGFWRYRRRLACATGPVRACASSPRAHKAEEAGVGLGTLRDTPCTGQRVHGREGGAKGTVLAVPFWPFWPAVHR